MPKKACCCVIPSTCQWCDREYYGQSGPSYYNDVSGTLTTELPSIGHPWVQRYRNFSGFCGYKHYRTPAPTPMPRAYYADNQNYYGDIYPAWFNSINMSQSVRDETTDESNAYFKFLFELKVEKKNQEGGYETIVDIDWEGYGSNLRPHPDACRSYNLASYEFKGSDICNVFYDEFKIGDICDVDFAKMPRGPWPYRLVCREDDIDNPDPLPTNADRDGAKYLSNYGTAFGVEDCPVDCPLMSNYLPEGQTPDETKLKFFYWLDPYARYTTPEWDVEDFKTKLSRKLSLHCLVPTKNTNNYSGCGGGGGPSFGPTESSNFCHYIPSQGNGFGEWCFGMDLEASSEIAALESAGFNWSNGREEKGLWINKTPTNALRVLFTLDHSDMEPGRVFRVFRDWDVQNGANSPLEWDNNDDGEFRITFKQKVTELAFSGLGCDCPFNNCGRFPICNDPREPGCHDYQTDFIECWTDKVSFTERGPMIIEMWTEGINTGAQVSDDGQILAKYSGNACTGLIMFACRGDNGGVSLSETTTRFPNIERLPGYSDDGSCAIAEHSYMNTKGDQPFSQGAIYSVITARYRNKYLPVTVATDFNSQYCVNYTGFLCNPDQNNETGLLDGIYPYGVVDCHPDPSRSQSGGYNCSEGANSNPPYCDLCYHNHVYEVPGISLRPWPTSVYIPKCFFECGKCPSIKKCCVLCQGVPNFTGGGIDVDTGDGENPPPPCNCDCDNGRCGNRNFTSANFLARNESLYGPPTYPNTTCTNSITPDCDGGGQGGVFPWCVTNTSPGYLGLFSSQIWFSGANVSTSIYGGVGPRACWGKNTDECLACGLNKLCPAGNAIGAGFLDGTNITWRNSLCRKVYARDEEPISKIIPTNLMGNLHFACGGTGTDCGDMRYTSECTVQNADNNNYPPQGGMAIPGRKWVVYTKPYTKSKLGFWAHETKYITQGINGCRVPTYIKINSKGPIEE
jgi:hypothetical protein